MEPASVVCLARQSIYDVDLDPCGYELLYRSSASSKGSGAIDGDSSAETAMSASTLSAALTDIGLDAIVGDKPAWVNVGASFLVDGLAAALPPERTVVEVLESTTASAPVLEAVARLRAEGYRIALDDFVFRPELAPMLELADIVKLDALALGTAGLEAQVALLWPYRVELVAEKVETHDVLGACRELGFTRFQGYFLSKPRVLSTERVSAETALRMQLIAQLNDRDADFDRLSEVIASDVALTYRMLRYINSAYIGLRRPVGSIREALIELGSQRVRSWATLLLISEAATGRRDLAAIALHRADMCEALAAVTGDDRQTGFTVGLLSVVDALLDCALDEALADLPIDEEVAAALLRGEGNLGDLLGRVIAYERGDFAEATRPPLDPPTLTRAYLQAIEWSSALLGRAPAA
jgi:EAL and modified HD-GYP domain-containing signal transduction protein